jgi:hypothetical protein
MMSKKNYFTLVFEGDITKIHGNPMKIKTPFGVAIASCSGNALEELDRLRDALDTIEKTTDDLSAEHVAHNALVGNMSDTADDEINEAELIMSVFIEDIESKRIKDIVERLRERTTRGYIDELCHEAASEIERLRCPPGKQSIVVGTVTGKFYEGYQVAGIPWAICHACGLKDYPCVNRDCPRKFPKQYPNI